MSNAEQPPLRCGKLRSKVTHLVLKKAPSNILPNPPSSNLIFGRREDLSIRDYLTLYHAIGDDWLWWGRLAHSKALQNQILQSPHTEIYVAEENGAFVGLAELDLSPLPDIEIRYFGVIQSHIGVGLGSYMLPHALAGAWRHKPRQIILNTCDFDHPNAIAFYEKHGFEISHTEVQIFDDPRVIGLLPRNAAPHIPLALP